jgi:hypothetical protein
MRLTRGVRFFAVRNYINIFMIKYLVLIGAGINFFGASFYIRDTLRGKTKPNRVTWLLWSVAPLIATVAALSEGVGWSVLPVFMSGFIPFLIFSSSFINKNSYWKLSKLDYCCGALSLLALVLWYISHEANIAIILAIISDILAALPTLIKAWHNPETESFITYCCAMFSALTSFFAIEEWNFVSLAFPSYLVLILLLILIIIKRKNIFKFA